MEEPVRLDEDVIGGQMARQTSNSVVTRSHEDSPVKNQSKIITTTNGLLTPALQTSEIGKASLAGHTAIEFNSQAASQNTENRLLEELGHNSR